jgi:hypothetical protein
MASPIEERHRAPVIASPPHGAAAAAPHAPGARLLHVDSTAGLVVGIGVLALSPWLAPLYGMSRTLVVGMGIANVAYGTFSGVLARRRRRPRALLAALVVANAAWAIACWVTAAALAESATWFGLASLVGEGAFVGGLAALEWRARDVLAPRD